MTVWLQLFVSCTGCQSPRRFSTSCACWFTSRFRDTHRNISQTFWHRLPIFQVDLHCVLHRVATLSCRRHVDKLAAEPFLLLHREHGTGYRRSWKCCDRWTCFVMIWKHFCFILSTGTRIRTDSVMRPRSSSRGCNTSVSVTVTVTVTVTWCASSVSVARVGPGHLLPPLSLHFLVFCSFLLFPSLVGFNYFLLLSIPFLSTRIVPLRFQAGGRRKRPNLGLVCCVYFVCVP